MSVHHVYLACKAEGCDHDAGIWLETYGCSETLTRKD